MKMIYNILKPKLLRDFNNYLLRNYPVVWRTQAIWVLFYGMVGAVLLFVAGFFYPIDAQHLTVEPDRPINIDSDSYHFYFIGFVIIGTLYWAYHQAQLGFPFTKIKDTLLTLTLYALCFYVLFAFATPAFRLGMIYRTAYHWIKTTDLKHFEQSGIYPYGFIFLKEDKNFNKKILVDSFFQRREAIFKSIYAVEDSLLPYRYLNDTIIWINWYNKHPNVVKNNLNHYLSNTSYLSNISWLSSILSLPSLPSLIEQSDEGIFMDSRLPISYLSYRSYPLSILYLSSMSSVLSYRSSLAYMSSMPDTSYQLSFTEITTSPYLEYISSYNTYYNTYKYKMIQSFDIGTNPYNFLNTQDSIVLKNRSNTTNDSIIFYRPTLPYSVENAVRSVKNAQQFWQERIYARHWYGVLSYVLILSILLFFASLPSSDGNSSGFFIFFIFYFLITFFGIISFKSFAKPLGTFPKNISNLVYLVIPILYCFWLFMLLLKKQVIKGFNFDLVISMVILFTIVGFLFFIMKSKNEELSDPIFKILQLPYDLAFYGIQALGILGAVLTTYVRTLPKQ